LAGSNRREREAIAYLIEENRLLRRQLGIERLRLTDDDRRRLAARVPSGPGGPPRDRHDRDAGHAPAVASPADCAEVDMCSATRPAQRPARDPALGCADGGGESDVGLAYGKGHAAIWTLRDLAKLTTAERMCLESY
jgi:hypothetical protein